MSSDSDAPPPAEPAPAVATLPASRCQQFWIRNSRRGIGPHNIRDIGESFRPGTTSGTEEAKLILVVLIGLVSALAAMRAFVLEMKVYFATNNKLPEEFQDGRYAVHADFALSPLTPLAVQADYIKAGRFLSISLLGASVCAFLLEIASVGGIFLIIFVIGAATSIRDTKIYRANCIDRMRRNLNEET